MKWLALNDLYDHGRPSDLLLLEQDSVSHEFSPPQRCFLQDPGFPKPWRRGTMKANYPFQDHHPGTAARAKFLFHFADVILFSCIIKCYLAKRVLNFFSLAARTKRERKLSCGRKYLCVGYRKRRNEKDLFVDMEKIT